MVVKDPDSVTLFFRNPTNIHRLKVSQLLTLTDLQANIDELNTQKLNDFNLANRDIQVGRLRDRMATIVEVAMVDGNTIDRSTTGRDAESSNLRHAAFIEGRHFG
jgi:hypothetical protein